MWARYCIGELATLLGVDKSTASRLTATFANRDFLERAPESEAFRLAPEVGRLGMVALGSGHNLIGLARAPMERLAEERSETVNLAVLKDHKIVNVAQVDGPTSWGSATGPDGRRSLTPPPTAKCCSRSQGRSSRIFPSTPLKAFTERTITNLKELNSELERVESAGWGSTLGELEEGFNGVAVPVFDASGRCLAALSVSGPAYRMLPQRLPEVAELCKKVAEEIGARLGTTSSASAQ